MDIKFPRAYWISGKSGNPDYALHFSKCFNIKNKENVILNICGLGFYYALINGERVGNEILQPAISKYDKTVYYNSYDVSEYLKTGENVIEVIVGNGFFNENLNDVWSWSHSVWKAAPKLIAEIYSDNELILKTDTTWKVKSSKTIYNGYRSGETYDAGFEGIDTDATLVTPPGGILKLQTFTPVRLIDTYKPVKRIKTVIIGEVYDFGTNLTGNVEITVKGKKGTKISIQYFERLRDNFSPDLEYYNHGVNKERFQLDEYILSGDGEEKWHGEFSYKGFRYIYVTCFGEYEYLDFEARRFYTDFKESGNIETDNPIISKIQDASKRTYLSNFIHIPTDCPHREKNGWTGDAHIAAETGLFNFNSFDGYEKWLDDIVDCQLLSGQIPCIAPTSSFGYEWGSGPSYDVVLYLLPWYLYLYSGEIRYLEKYYPAMEKYFSYYKNTVENGICKIGLSDWLPMPDAEEMPEYSMETAYSYYIAVLFSKISKLLNNNDNAVKADVYSNEIKDAFNKKYGNLKSNNQTFYAVQLCLGINDNKDYLLKELLRVIKNDNYHIMGGLFCSNLLLNALSENDAVDVAYQIASQKDYPSWSELIDKCGDTLGENWQGGASRNHPAFASISSWYYKALAGINLDENTPGFKNIILTPNTPSDIKSFKAWHQTPYGNISVAWNEKELTVNIPIECTADFKYGNINEKLSAGTYSFERIYL